MSAPTLTRFHMTLAIAVLLDLLALCLRSWPLFGVVTAAFFVAMALGVMIPRMQFFGPFVCRGPGARRRVALTFDDGPDARSTPVLLDLLRETKTEAAFFCVGQKVEAQPELAARILREGHLVENHSYSHHNATNLFTLARLQSELAQTQLAIQQATGVVPTCFRPPMGLSNPRVFAASRAFGLTVVGWTSRAFDTMVRDPDRVVARILRSVQPGAIILLHDGNIPADRLVRTVRTLLDKLHGLGYEVARLDKVLE